MNGKRKPIRRRVQRIVLLTSAIVMGLAGLIGLLSMLSIRATGRDALREQLEINLSNTIGDKAALADEQFGKYLSYVSGFAAYIHDLYENPSRYTDQEVLPPDAANQGRMTMQRYLRDGGVALEDVERELKLFGNLEVYWKNAVAQNEGIITTVYIGTESGLHIAYDPASELGVEPGSAESHFDYSASEWYVKARDAGKPGITDIYQDSYGRGAMISCYAPFYDEKGAFAGSVSMDILVNDLYSKVVSMDLGEGGGVLLLDRAGSTIDPEEGNTIVAGSSLIHDERLLSAFARQESGSLLSGEGIYYAYSPVRSIGWTLCIGIPESTVLSSLYRMDRSIQYAILIFGAILLLLVVSVFFVSRRFAKTITGPLIRLGNDARTISRGDLSYRAEIQENDEVGDLAGNFNEMAASLSKYIADLTRVTAEKERIGAELNVATQIQADMLPRIFPAFPGRGDLDIYASMDPAKEVGGDFYDFFFVDDSRLCLVIADVSGKGVPAALFMVIAKTLIKNQAMLGLSPAEILNNVNHQLCDGNEAEMFVTVWLAVLDLKTGRGLAANAGHEHPALMRKSEGRYELVEYRHSPAVAVMPDLRFREHEFVLSPGDRLFVYTDGVPEATNADNELFGAERMTAALNVDPDAAPRQVLENVRRAVDAFVQDAVQFDDLTMMCLEYIGPRPEPAE